MYFFNFFFLTTMYVEVWFAATSVTPTPQDDMVFLKKLFSYQILDTKISQVAVSKFINRLRYSESPSPQ